MITRPPTVDKAGGMLTIYGVAVLSLMMVMYALEKRSRTFVLAFALG
jgi:hypothetical protein